MAQHIIIFFPCQSFNRCSPFNCLQNEPKAFLVTIPEAPAGLYSSICRSCAHHSLRCGPLSCNYVCSRDECLFSTLGWKPIKEKGTTGIRSLDPWCREVYTWPINPPDHGAPLWSNHLIFTYQWPKLKIWPQYISTLVLLLLYYDL